MGGGILLTHGLGEIISESPLSMKRRGMRGRHGSTADHWGVNGFGYLKLGGES
jgi:hypothetical protein